MDTLFKFQPYAQTLQLNGWHRDEQTATLRLRQAQGLKPRQRVVEQPLPAVVDSEQLPLTPRRAVWLVLKRADEREAAEQQRLDLVKQQRQPLRQAVELAEGFIHLVRHRQSQQLDDWLAQANGSNVAMFQRFAKRLRDDYDAVKAGMTLPWSNGPVEGQVNRLKMIKRSMYGRAKLDLLQRRFLPAT